MIFRNLGVLSEDPAAFFIFTAMLLAAVVASVTFHEFSHALTATSLGDDTARRLGRLSLNPKAHLDPAGSIMFLLAGFGWGKPVPVNAYAFGGNALRSMMLVAFAGPLSNFVLAFLIGLLFKIGIVEWPFNVFFTPLSSSAPLSLVIGQFFAMWFFLNIILGVFNLLPVSPLDGSKVLAGCCRHHWRCHFFGWTATARESSWLSSCWTSCLAWASSTGYLARRYGSLRTFSCRATWRNGPTGAYNVPTYRA